MKRRNFIKGTAALTGLAAVTGLYSWQIEPFWLEFVEQDMPVKNLPSNLEGKTLLQISDIHVGNRFDSSFIIDAFKKAKQHKPDIVVYTGDYVSWEDQTQYAQLEKVMKHAVIGTIGTAAILGNHDYGKNWSENDVASKITSILHTHKVPVLRNASLNISGLTIIGIDDYWATNFNPKKALSNYSTRDASIVLCHNPDVCDLDVWNRYEGWILSGHTHGGQVKPPFLDPPILPVKNPKYTAGHIPLSNNRDLYINRALGCLHQVRFNVRPEITIFKLQKA